MDNSFRQTEEETTTLPHNALGTNMANREELTRLPVFLNDAFTVLESETMSAKDLVFEDMGKTMKLNMMAFVDLKALIVQSKDFA